jgi:ribonucleoside-diphosphate reductase alpha chain
MRFEPSGQMNEADIRIAKSIVDYVFRLDGQEVPDRRPAGGDRDPLAGGEGTRLAERYANGGGSAEPQETSPLEATPTGPKPPRSTGREDAVDCAKCCGRMIRTRSCYTCRDCGTNTSCSSLSRCICDKFGEGLGSGCELLRDIERF